MHSYQNHMSWKWLSSHEFNRKQKKSFSPPLCVYSHITSTTTRPDSFNTPRWSVADPRTLRSRAPGQLFKNWSDAEERSKTLGEQMGAFSPHEASAQLRSPPQHRASRCSCWRGRWNRALVISVPRQQLLLKLNKVLIQSVIFTLVCLEVGDDLWCVCVMFVVSRSDELEPPVHVHVPPVCALLYTVCMHILSVVDQADDL